MAVIEIAKIQVRRGQENQTGVPVLAGGEFAWAADTEHLYIGLRREDGGARDANIRVLTENDERNFFSIAATTSTYIYRDFTDITDYYGFGETERTIQDKLDDEVSVKDFGVIGNGIDDDTARLQFAIDRMFISTATQYQITSGIHQRRKLKLPTGNFRITGTIYIPSYTSLIGEGKDKTIITLASTGTSTHIFQTVDPRSIVEVGAASHQGPYVNFDNYLMESLTRPRNVTIEGMTLQYDVAATTISQVSSLISLDCAPNSIIRDVKFQGHYMPGTGMSTGSNYCGINFRALPAVGGENIVVENCEFKNLYYGVKSNYDVDYITIRDSEFYELAKGIALNEPADPVDNVGPRFGHFQSNTFERIEESAIYVGTGTFYNTTVTTHVSEANKFINVGNYVNGTGEGSNTGTAVITYLTQGNISFNDHFERLYHHSVGSTATGYMNPLILGRSTIDSKSAISRYIAPSTVDTILRFPITGFGQHAVIKYNVFEPTVSTSTVDRQGIINIYIKDGPNPSLVYDDNYNFINESGDFIIVADVNGTYRYADIRAWNQTSSTTYIVEYQFDLMV